MSISVKDAIYTLRDAIQQDPDYAWSWHCNIATASMDEGLDHAASNRAAARFMSTLFGVDMTKHEQFKGTQSPIKFKDGVPCHHPGCKHHMKHPCEVCGRTGAIGNVY